MSWSKWIECNVNQKGEVDTSSLWRIADSAGVYAIATHTSGWWSSSYSIHYVGRTRRSIRDRLKNHLHCHSNGSKQIRALLQQKKDIPSTPLTALYVCCIETRDHKIVERRYIESLDPLLNIQGGRELPEGLTHEDILRSELDD